MRGEPARLLCALALVLLCVAANFQGAYCRGGGGSGHGSGGARPFLYGAGAGAIAGAGAGALAGRAASGPHSDAGEPHGRVASRVSGTAALFAAAALVCWL